MQSGTQDTKPKDALRGRWTYRSFMSNPDLEVDFGDLEFGRGELLVEYVCWGKFVGRLILAEDYELRLTGTVCPGDPPTIRFDGFGDTADSNGHNYQYFACVMPLWPHDPRKRPTMIGSVIRAAPKEGAEARPGSASTFIAIKQNDLPDPEQAQSESASATPSASPSSAGGTADSGMTSDPPPAGAAAGDAPSGAGSTSGATTQPSPSPALDPDDYEYGSEGRRPRR